MLIKTSVCSLIGALALTAAETTLTGTISDEMCGADHSAMAHDGKKMNAHDCTLMCTKDGSKYVFVSSGKVHPIANQDLPELSKHAGHTVMVVGDLASDGKTLTISKVEMK